MLKPHPSAMHQRPTASTVSGRADVIVLGAGVVGVTTAYSLARRGLKVAIVDRAEGPGCRTSFANGVQLSYAYTDAFGSPAMLQKLPLLALGRDQSFRIHATVGPDFLEWGLRILRNCTSARFSRNTKAGLALALESRLAMHALIERHEFDFGHEVAGKMHLFYSRSAFAVARQVMALKRGHGAVQNALSPKEALAIEPALAGALGLEGVIHSPEDEVGDPFRFATGLLDVLVRDYGVETYFGFDADRLRIERGAVGITDAAGATISGDRLAVCLGVAAPHFLRKAEPGAGLADEGLFVHRRSGRDGAAGQHYRYCPQDRVLLAGRANASHGPRRIGGLGSGPSGPAISGARPAGAPVAPRCGRLRSLRERMGRASADVAFLGAHHLAPPARTAAQHRPRDAGLDLRHGRGGTRRIADR